MSSRRAMTWLLWLVFLFTLPLPYFMIESGRVPAAQLILFAALTAPLAITDPGFTTRFVAALFVAQALLYSGLLYVLARLTVRALERHLAPARRAPVIVAVIIVLAAAASFDLYRAPLSHGPGATNWLGVFF